jgi:hypothetical protein
MSITKQTNMKTTTIAALLIALSINITAQVKVRPRNQDPKPLEPRNESQNNPAQQNNNQSGNHWGNGWGWGGGWGYNNCGPNVGVTIGFGGPYYGNAYAYNNNYYNGYNVRKAAKYSIRSAGNMINQAVAFDTWNDIYSPLLAKAIRHYNYARQLYWWGNYAAAYNHAERAGYLAWYSLQYFQDPYYNNYNNGGYGQPNPYSDPYNPYYRSDQAGNTGNNGQVPNSNEGFRKGEVPKSEGIDKELPGSEKADKELIKSFDKSELKDE